MRLGLAVALTVAAAPLSAQRIAPVLPRAELAPPSLAVAPPRARRGVDAALRVPRFDLPAWTAPLASAVVPGVGQAVLRQQRAVAYLAVEAFVWLQYFKDRRDWRQQRTAYRDLAGRVARSPFSADPAVGAWDYYERMEHFLESGVYSLSGSLTDVQPESDESTYNGAMWLLARRNFWPNPSIAPPVSSPEYQHALQFYESRAVRPGYRWSWRNAQLEQDLYRRTINKANDAVRRATSDLGVLLANHVLSAVDAFAVLQLRASQSARGDLQLEWRIPSPFR